MKIRILLSVAFVCLMAVLSAQATNLLISEYVEGTSYNKAIEIFNGTGSPVDLSTVSLKKQTNGAGSFGSELVLSGTLADNDVFVVCSSATGGTNLAGEPFVDLATTSQAVNFNGNDAVGLFRNGVMIDVVGVENSVDNWGQNMTLVRNANVGSPSLIYNVAEWTQYPVDTFTYLGYHVFTGGTTETTLTLISPNTAVNWYYGQTYNIMWSTTNYDGNIEVGLLNGTDYSILADDIANTGTFAWTIPNTLPAGTDYRIKVSTEADTLFDISEEAFSIGELPITLVANIGELRASVADGTTIYKVTGEAIMAYQQTYRNKKYFQDSTGGIEVDDPDGIITNIYSIGDAVPDLIGTLTVYHELLQFTPYTNASDAVTTGNEVTATDVTIAELSANFDAYESRLVNINNVTFLDTTTPFVTGMNYNISDGTGQMIFRTAFFDADYIAQAIPTTPVNMKAIPTQYDAVLEVTARFLADFTPVANNDQTDPSAMAVRISNYPNPFRGATTFNVYTKTTLPLALEIYNLKGQLVRTIDNGISKAGQNQVRWDALDNNGKPVSSGVYFYNIKGGKFTSSKKMILLK